MRLFIMRKPSKPTEEGAATVIQKNGKYNVRLVGNPATQLSEETRAYFKKKNIDLREFTLDGKGKRDEFLAENPNLKLTGFKK